MKAKYTVTKIFLYSLVIPAFISVILFGSHWIIDEYERSGKEATALREVYFESQKTLIKEETDKVIDYINYKKSQAEERLKQHIQSRTR